MPSKIILEPGAVIHLSELGYYNVIYPCEDQTHTLSERLVLEPYAGKCARISGFTPVTVPESLVPQLDGWKVAWVKS